MDRGSAQESQDFNNQQEGKILNLYSKRIVVLGVPKPKNGTSQEIEAWKTSLQPIYRSNSWRWRGTDPFGADPCHGAIAIVMFGKHYSKTATLKLMPHQLAWFAYVVSLC